MGLDPDVAVGIDEALVCKLFRLFLTLISKLYNLVICVVEIFEELDHVLLVLVVLFGENIRLNNWAHTRAVIENVLPNFDII